MYFTHFNNDDNVHDNVAEAAIIPGSWRKDLGCISLKHSKPSWL